MPIKKIAIGFTILGTLFVSLGDRVLPQPMSGYSVSARETVIGWLPKIRQQNHNAKTEGKVKELDNY